MIRASLALVAAMLLVSCSASTPVPSPAPTPIPAAAASAVAVAELDGGPDVKVVSTRLSTYGAEANGTIVPADTPVWVVVLSGAFQLPSCGPMTATPHPCPSPATSARALVDARSGAFIQGTVPAPSAT